MGKPRSRRNFAADHKFYAYEAAGEAFVQEHIVDTRHRCSDGHVQRRSMRPSWHRWRSSSPPFEVSCTIEGKGGPATRSCSATRRSSAMRARQNILAAYELQAWEAAARKEEPGPSDPPREVAQVGRRRDRRANPLALRRARRSARRSRLSRDAGVVARDA